jgi:hypothetical protein
MKSDPNTVVGARERGTWARCAVFGLGLALAVTSASAQAHPWAEWGKIWAGAFDGWKLESLTAVPHPGVYALQIEAANPPVIAGGPAIQPLQTDAPLLIGSGDSQETVIPPAVECSWSPGACTVTVTLTKAHVTPIAIRSGTAGLQEAIDYDRVHGGTVVLDPAWSGATTMITAATGSAAVQIEDLRGGQSTWYGWNGQSYIPSLQVNATSSGGIGVSTLKATNPPIDESSLAGVVIPAVTPDGRYNQHGHAVAGSTSFTTVDAVFEPADVGKTIVVANAGADGRGFATTIAAYISPTAITLAAAPLQSVAAGITQFCWGSDDAAALMSAAAQALSSPHGALYLPAGIYLTTAPLVFQAADGLTIAGAGDGGPNQSGLGTRLVYAGAAGGAPGSGTENALLRVSGTGITVHDLALDGGGLATAALWADTTLNPIFSLHIQNVGSFDAAYWSTIWGQPDSNAFAGQLLGMASTVNLLWGQSGCGYQFSNCTGDPLRDGGGNLINIGNGNFNFAMSDSQGLANGPNRGFGSRSVLIYSGNDFVFDNLYLPPLGGVNQPSVDVEGGNNFSFHSIYDENGYGLLDKVGWPFTVNGWLTRSGSAYTMPHQAMRIENQGRVTLQSIQSDGLPLVLPDGADVNCVGRCVESTRFGSDQVWSGLSASVTSVSRSAGTAVLTTSSQSLAAGDWVTVLGLSNSVYNGEWQLTGATPTSISFALAGTQTPAGDGGTVAITAGLVGPATGHSLSGGGPMFDADVLADGSASSATQVTEALANPQALLGVMAFPPDFGGANGEFLPDSLQTGLNLLDLRPLNGSPAPFWHFSGAGGVIGRWEIGGTGIQPGSFAAAAPLEVQAPAGPDEIVSQWECPTVGSTCRLNFNDSDLSPTAPVAQLWWRGGATPAWAFDFAGQPVLSASSSGGSPLLQLGAPGSTNLISGSSLDVHASGLMTTAQLSLVEGPAPTAVLGQDSLWADAGSHRLWFNPNSSGALLLPGLAAAGAAGDVPQLAPNGIDLADSGLAAGDATKINGLPVPAGAGLLGSDASGHLLAATRAQAASFATATNCASTAAPAACVSAAAGAVTLAVGSTSVVVNTTAVTADSQILLTFDASLGGRLGVTCSSVPLQPFVSARTSGTSFTLNVSSSPASHPACFSFFIVN